MQGDTGQATQPQAGPSMFHPPASGIPSSHSTTLSPEAAAFPSSSREQQENHQQSRSPVQQREPLLRIRVLAVEKRGKELNVRLDAATNLAPFRHSQYPPFLRSYRELTFFALSLSVHVPSQILAALPLPPLTTTFPSPADSSQTEARLLCQTLSRWFARLTAEPAHRDHPETRNFVEADYSYHPIPPHVDYAPTLVQKRWRAVMEHAASVERGISVDLGAGLGLPSGVLSTPATPPRSGGGGGFLGFGGSKSSSSTVPGGKGLSLSRNVHDEDEDLVAARMEVTRLELQFSEAANKGFKVVESRAKVTEQLSALSNKLHTLAGVEATRQLSSDMGLPTDLRKLADGLPAVDLTQQATSHTETMTLLYQLMYQSSNARAAKEALLARNALVEEHHEATKRTLLKKREIEGLKARMGTAGVSRDRIEMCIEEFAEASRYANALRLDLGRLSKSMHGSLKNHSRNAHADLQAALVEHARGTVFHLRKDIQALKGLRADLRGDAKEVKERRAAELLTASQSEASEATEKHLAGAVKSPGESTAVKADTTFDALAQVSGGPSAEAQQANFKTNRIREQQDLHGSDATATQDSSTSTIADPMSLSTAPDLEGTTPSPSTQDQTAFSPPSFAPAQRPPLVQPWVKGSSEPTSDFSPSALRSAYDSADESTAPIPPTSSSSAAWNSPEPRDPRMTQSLYQPSERLDLPQQQQQGSTEDGRSLGMGGSGFLPRSNTGFGSASGGGKEGGGFVAGAFGSGRGRGRISASEAARSLAGRF